MISNELYIIITHIVFVMISFYTILITFNSDFKITNLEKINAWILFGLYSTYLFFFKEHVQLFTNESHELNLPFGGTVKLDGTLIPLILHSELKLTAF